MRARAPCPFRGRRRWPWCPRRPAWPSGDRSRAAPAARPTRAPPQTRRSAVAVAACGCAARHGEACGREHVHVRSACTGRVGGNADARARVRRGRRRGVACLRRRQLVERDDRQLVARAGHEPREERRRPARDLVDEELLELGQRARADGVGERAQVGDGVGREREALEPAEGAALGGERAERRDVVDLVRAKVELLWVAGGADPRGDCRGG